MQELKKVMKLSRRAYYETHLAVINCLLPKKMTVREMEVLACFMSLRGDIATYRFGPTGRKVVMKELGISPAGLSNFIGDLKEKEFLIEVGDMLTIWPLLIPEETQQDYRIRIVNETDTPVTSN